MLFSKIVTDEAGFLMSSKRVSEVIWLGPRIIAILAMETSQTTHSAIKVLCSGNYLVPKYKKD